MRFEHVLHALAMGAVVVVLGGWLLAVWLRRSHLQWTWALLALPASLVLRSGGSPLALPVFGASMLAAGLGARWHGLDLGHGADFAEAARARRRVREVVQTASHRLSTRRHGWVRNGRLVVGQSQRGAPVSIPVGYQSGSHTLVLGATGSGKTVSEAWVASRLIEAGHGAVAIDPKGDRLLREQLALAAGRRGCRFLEWTPDGPLAYNPYARGSDTEVADKALSGERFTEPHYLRQAQRYLGHTVRAMRAAGVPVTPASLMGHFDPRQLEVTVRSLPAEEAQQTESYLDGLSERQRRDLAGVRDRLSILAESDIQRWLDPASGAQSLDVHEAVSAGDVVYFRLDSDRRPLLAGMLASAIVSDLITLVARQQADPVPTVVLVDEFSAVAAEHVARLFGRARSAGVSLILGTQELADLKTVGDGALREQTLGNVATVIAHRQNVPESAELIAAMAGTKPAWITTQQTEEGLLGAGISGRGSRRRGHEYQIHPSRIKQLGTGEAVVITPGSGPPTITRINHP